MLPFRWPYYACVACLASLLGLARPVHAENQASADKVEVPAPERLLPEILGPGERMFWGEHGLMRTIGAFPLTEESRENELLLRRGMLTAHQVGGFITLISMLATVYYGQMILNGEDGYEEGKTTLAWTTVSLYSVTAALSLLSPPPLIRRKGWSSVSTHKALAWAHVTGMILTPVLGTMLDDRDDLRAFHQISGYATTAAFAAAMLVVTF
jgi:hypothetical protein